MNALLPGRESAAGERIPPFGRAYPAPTATPELDDPLLLRRHAETVLSAHPPLRPTESWSGGVGQQAQAQTHLFSQESPLERWRADLECTVRILGAEQRANELQAYLRDVAQRGLITPEVATAAWNAWTAIRRALGVAFTVPDACPGGMGQILLTWDRGPHHLELEVFPSGERDFFYRNRQTGELWECDYPVDEPVPAEALARLRLFA